MASIGQWHLGRIFPYFVYDQGNFTVNAANDNLQFIFQSPPDGPTITKGAIRWGAKTGAPGAYRLSLQGVDASGYADGTIKSGSGANDVLVALPTDAAAGALGAYSFGGGGYNSSPGEMLAMVIDSVNTPDAGNCWSFGRYVSSTFYHGFPYPVSVDAATPTKSGSMPTFLVGDGTTWWGGVLSQTTAGYTLVDGSPVFAGTYFTIPAAVGATASCIGFWYPQYMAAGNTIRVSLYDTADNVLASNDIDSDHNYNFTGYSYNLGYWDAGAVALTCGTTYRLVIRSTTANTLRLPFIDVSEAAMLDAYPAAQWMYHTEGDVGGWTETTTKRSAIGPIISDITEPTGGLLRHPGMTGGILG